MDTIAIIGIAIVIIIQVARVDSRLSSIDASLKHLLNHITDIWEEVKKK